MVNTKIKTKSTNQQPGELPDHGEKLMNWDFPEYEKHQRGIVWYAVITIASIGLLIWSIIIEENILFASIIVIVLIIIFITSRSKPDVLTLNIFEDGIQIGEKFYFYKEIKKFWVVYEPPNVKTIYFSLYSNLRPLISIPLMDTNPLKLREILLEFIEEDLEHDSETSSDSWNRILKL